MTRELQSTLEASGTEWPALRNHIPCMAYVIQLALGANLSNLGVTGHTKSWEAHECDHQFGENESMDIGKSQRLRREGNATINKVSAMRPGLANIIEKVRISRNFKSPETDNDIAVNAGCIACSDCQLSKWVLWFSTSECTHRSSTYHVCEDTLQLNTGDGWESLPIMRNHLRVAQ